MATLVSEVVFDTTVAVPLIAELVAATTYYIAQDAELAAETTAAAIIAGVIGAYIAVQYTQLANDYYELYRQQRQFYFDNFQTFGEAPLLIQVFDNPLAGNGQVGALYQPEYSNQSNVIGTFASNDFSGNQDFLNGDWWDRHANFYGTSALRIGTYRNAFGGVFNGPGEPKDLDVAASIADGSNYLYRYEEHRKDVYDERTWEWQNQALNFGVKQASVVQSGLATSFKFLDTAAEGMSDFFSTQSNGLAMQSAYKSSFNNTGRELAASSQRGSSMSISTNLGQGDYGYRKQVMPEGIDHKIMQGPNRGVA